MKLNKLLPIVALSGIATVAMPLVGLVGCNKQHSNSLSWDFVAKDGYQSQVKQKTVTSAYRQADACKYYLKDAKQNPLIILDDLMLTENALFQLLHLEYGEYLSQYSVEIKDVSVDADNCLVSMHYICHIKVNATSTMEAMQSDIDIIYENIPFISYYELSGSEKYNASMWLFLPEYALNLSKDNLITYFDTLTHNWSIHGTFFSNLVTNDEGDVVEINLDNDHHSAADVTTSVLYALSNSTNTFTSLYFDNVPVAGDYDLVYDSTEVYMHLTQPVSLQETHFPTYFAIDLSKYEASLKSNVKLKFFEGTTPTINVHFTGKFGDKFYQKNDFHFADFSYDKEIALTKADKIMLGIWSTDSLDDFNLQVSFVG